MNSTIQRKIKPISFILILFFISTGTFQKAWSSPEEWFIETTMAPKKGPKYFFRPVPDTPFISYTSGTRNYLLNMETGKEINIPHWVDAIPTPFKGLVTIPKLVPNIRVAPRFGFIPEFGSMEFYRTKDLIEGKKRAFFKDPSLPGAYQTMAIVDKGPEKIVLRMVTESFLNKKRVFLQDYEILLNGDQSPKKIRPLYKRAKKFCPNIEISLPMLSKSGKYFAAVDPKTRHMKLYTMDKKFKCHLFKDLQMPTGKVDFSYDDSLMAFHVSPVRPKDVAYVVKTQDLDNQIDIMTYNLETGAFNWVTECQKSNCYYPSFTPQGSLYYLKQKPNASFEFVKLKRKDLLK